MITYQLTIVIGGREQAITIQADGCNTDGNTYEFHVDGSPVAWVPSAITVEIKEL